MKQCPEGTIFSTSPFKCEDVQNVTECPSTSATSSPVTGPIGDKNEIICLVPLLFFIILLNSITDVPYQCEEDGSFPIENCSVSYIICVGCALENCTAYPEVNWFLNKLWKSNLKPTSFVLLKECPAGSFSTFHPVERKCSANNPYCSPTEETDPTTTTNLITSTSGIEVTASSTTETTFPITSPCSTSSDITNPTQSTAQTTDPDTPTRQPFDLSGELDNLQITVFIIIGVVGTIFVTMAVGIIVLYKVLDKFVDIKFQKIPTFRFTPLFFPRTGWMWSWIGGFHPHWGSVDQVPSTKAVTYYPITKCTNEKGHIKNALIAYHKTLRLTSPSGYRPSCKLFLFPNHILKS